MLNLQAEVHVARFGWEKMARVQHAPTGASRAAGDGERRCFVDSV